MSANSTEQIAGAGEAREHPAGNGVVVLLVAALGGGLVALWVVFVGLFMGGRLVTLVRRERGEAWLVTGADGATA